MSLFGEALPYEDDTAASLIRRTGYPPEGKYVQMPENYVCPCCKEFSEAQERERLIIAAQQEKEKEKRRLMQLDVFDERAKPLPTNNGNRRKIYRRVDEEDTLAQQQPEVPPPPPTLDELRRQKKQETSPAKLIVTVHYGKNLEAAPKDPMSVIVRCGAFEGQTAKVQRGKGNVTTWDELFEFPYPNPNENLEVLVVNDALPESNDHLLGGVVVPSNALHDTNRGDEESLPVYPENEMQTAFDKSKEGPLGAVVVSWYVSEDGKEQLNESALDDQNLKQPLECVFVAHRVFQYTDNGSEPYPGGVLCVLRDTDDNCSDSILYLPGSNMEPSLSPYYGKEGYHYLPENPSQMMQLNTEKKLGHILVCVPKQESAPNQEEEEELFVVGAVPIDFEKLYHKGSAVLLIESKSMDDALWGEISIEWLNRSLDSDRKPPIVDVDNESLYVTVVRGLNLTNGEKEPVKEAYVSVAAGEMEGITVLAPSAVDAEQNNVITWNQEIRFIDVDPKENNLEVVAFENGNPVSTGHVVLEDQDEGTVVIAMHDMYHEDDYRGEIIVNYKRLHVQHGEDATHHSDQDEQREANESAEDGDRASSGYNDRAADADQDDDQHHDDEQKEQNEDDERQSRDLKEAQSAHEEGDEEEEEHLHEHDEQNDSSAEEDKEDDHNEQREYEQNEKEEEASSSHHAGSEEEEEHHADRRDEDEEDGKDRDAAEHEHDEEEEDRDHQHHDDEEEEEEEEHKHASDDEEAAQSDHEDENQHDEEQDEKEEKEDNDDENEDKDRDASEHEHQDEDEEEHKEHEEEEDRDSQKDKEDEEDEYDEYHELYEKEEDADEGRDGHDKNEEEHADRDAAHDDNEEDKDNADREDEDEYDAYHDRFGADDPKDNEEYGDEDAHRGDSAEGSEHDGANEDEGEKGHHGEDNEEEEQQSGHNHGEDNEEEEEDAAHQHNDGHEGEEEEADNNDRNRDLDDQEEGHDEYGQEEHVAHSDNDDEEAAHQEEPAQDAEGDEGHPGDQLGGDEHDKAAEEEEEHDIVDDNATDMALGDAKRGKSPSKRPNWSDKRTTTSYKKPWYPAGQPTNENHLPYEKTKRSKSTRESIRNLETRRTRLEEESVRRASTPRSSLSSPHLPQ